MKMRGFLCYRYFRKGTVRLENKEFVVRSGYFEQRILHIPAQQIIRKLFQILLPFNRQINCL
jgi:hypothetical protein